MSLKSPVELAPPIVVNSRFRGQPITGVQRYARELIARLPSLREIEPLHLKSGALGHLWEQRELPRLVKDSLLWSPCNTGPLSVRRQVVTIHDCSFYDHPEAFSPAFRIWYRWLSRQLANRVARVITDSEFSRTRLIEHLQIDPQKVDVIYIGVSEFFRRPTPNEMEAVRRKYQLPENYVLYVGSLEPRKNLKRLLQAWRSLGKKAESHRLVLGGAAHRVFSKMDWGPLSDNVLFTGYVPEEHLPALYAGAKLYVCPSLYEGFGLTILEAMACGTPVLCSRTTSLGEIASDAALLVDPKDTDAIALAIERGLSDEKLRKTLIDRGFKRVKEFNWDQAAEKTWKVLVQAAEETMR